MFQNLLSTQRKKEFKIEYITRLATVVSLLLAGAFVVGLITLFPSYVDVTDTLHKKQAELENKQREVDENKEFIYDTSKSAYMLLALEKQYKEDKVVALLDELLEKRPEGISIVGISYNRKENRLILEGIAEKRDTVAPFARTLEGCEGVSSVPVPVTDLAEKTNLNFKLNIEIEANEET